MNINRVVIAGNLTRDPELKFTPKGTAVCSFGVAVNRRWTSESGEKKEEVTFVENVAWGKTAEMIAQYFRKGSPIYLEGRLTQESWEDKNTKEKKSKTKVTVEGFQFVGKAERQEATTERKPEVAAGGPVDSDSVPF